MSKKFRDDVAYEGQAPPRGSVVSRTRPDAPRLLGFAESLRDLGVTSLGVENIDTTAMEIGEQIREARQRRGFSQAQLARKIGWNQGDLSNIELGKGKDGPSYRTLRNLAVAMDVELPINRQAAHAGAIVVRASDPDLVSASATSFDVIEPLFPRHHWLEVCQVVQGRFASATDLGHSDTCYLIGVEPNAKVSLRPDAPGTILAAVRKGGGYVHTHGARVRYKEQAAGEPLAILDLTSEVEIRTAEAEGMTLMMVPAQVIMSRFNEDSAD